MDMDSPPHNVPFDPDFSINLDIDIPITTKRAKELTPPPSPPNTIANLTLEQYIPLGCFTYSSDQCPADNYDDSSGSVGSWVEVLEFLPEILSSTIPWKALVDLWRAHWIRIERFVTQMGDIRRVWKVYVLPDDVARTVIERNSSRLRKCLIQVLETADISPVRWTGQVTYDATSSFDLWGTSENRSLFYMFNTLPSPNPSMQLIDNHFDKIAAKELLDPQQNLTGLNTSLYPYQRRSAAMMLQREVAPERQLDPRLEARVCPVGNTFYYGARDCTFFREPRFYDSVRGGILSETMGLGKTLMVLALIVATKGHWPKVPPIFANGNVPVRHRMLPLLDLAAAKVARTGMPWRKVFDDLKHKDDIELDNCIAVMEQQATIYEIPAIPLRTSRRLTFSTPPEVVRLCHGTIVVVPRNLLLQWQTELAKHVQHGTLKVLVMGDSKTPMPAQEELVTYDVVLFSRPRFEAEAKRSNDDEMIPYVSPLKGLHWLRIVIDEGHNFGSNNTNAALVADKLVRAERRWIVSGTPARDLLGIEVELEAITYAGPLEDAQNLRTASLEQRKQFNTDQEAASGAIKALGALASRFLKAEPWAATDSNNTDTARWDDYIYRHEAHSARTFSGFSSCFRRTLENLVVKTRPEDVERDIELPPLTHDVIRLEPCYFDKLTSNLFALLFTSNAITSERTDVDYLFHRGSTTHLHRLIANLRQSGFHWTGFHEDDVLATLGVSERYLAKPDRKCSAEDELLLRECMDAARIAISSSAWKAVSETQEMGMIMNDWPKPAIESWAFKDCTDPVMMGLTEALKAQEFVNKHLPSDDIPENLAVEGATLRAKKQEEVELEAARRARRSENSTQMVKQGVPKSSLQTDTTRLRVLDDDDRASTPKTQKNATDRATTLLPAAKASNLSSNSPSSLTSHVMGTPEKRKRSSRLRISSGDSNVELSASSALGRCSVIGTTSSKFSYIIDRVLELHTSEKILIFFDANHQAYYLAQAFELLHIKHLIYANTLTGEQRSKYVVLFDTDPVNRVLLMDIKQAAHGLNITSASRVFFLNPVCSPSVEAQAMKRAHRIGQMRPVHVETLVLKHTVEEAMHDRATKMTRHEHLQAAKFLEDDLAITRIIQQARVLPIRSEEREGRGQMAPLKTPQQIFGRPGRSGPKASELEKELFGDAEAEASRDAELADLDCGQAASKKRRKAGSVAAKKSRASTSKSNSKEATPSITSGTFELREASASAAAVSTGPEPSNAPTPSPSGALYNSIFGGD